MSQPTSVLSKELLPASVAIFATAALASFQALGIAAALPDIATDLGDVALLPWAITSFLLTSSLATVIAGPFIDSVGVKRMFRLGVVTFSLMGFASAFAPTMTALVALRALQGLGAGVILSCGNAAISLVFPDHLAGRAFAANATVWGVMGVVGPAVAASILTFLSWQWILYVNLPLGILALAAGWRAFPGPFGRSEGRVDVTGPVLLAVMTIAMLFAVEALSAVSLIWLVAVGGSIALYARHARRSTNPVVKLEHVSRQPHLGLGTSIGFLLTGTFAVNSYIPLFVRAGKNGSAAMTAWSVLPLTVGWTLGAIVASRLADRHSESWIVTLGFLVNLPSLTVLWVLVDRNAPLAALFAAFLMIGAGVGMSTNAALTLLRAVTESAKIGRVSAAHLFMRNQGFTFGAAIGGAVMLFVIGNQIGDVELVREVIASSADASPRAAASVRAGFQSSVAVGILASAIGMAAAVRMRRHLTTARETRREPVKPPLRLRGQGDGLVR